MVIDGEQYADIRHGPVHDSSWHKALVGLAGWLAEHKWHGRGSRFSFDMSNSNSGGLDAFYILRALWEENSSACDDEIRRRFRRYECDTWELLHEPEIWAAIEGVAAALREKGKLTAAEVEALLLPDWHPQR